tara:strand:+ start:72 stop:356 length:285 start_codon:yes stop_codon:yes gene_type:complete
MKELLLIIAEAGMGLFTTLRSYAPADFELQVECALIDTDIHEAKAMRGKMSRIADTLASQSNGPAGSAWANVAFNLNPSTGNTQRVGRSFNRFG